MRKNSIRNKNNDSLDSFEFLLDTMCNTFGGIVFIALFLTLLAQSLNINKIESNNIDEKNNIDNIKDEDFNSDRNKLLKVIESVKANLLLNDQIKVIQSNISNYKQNIKSVKDNIKELKKDIDMLNQKIEAAEKPDQRELRLPKLHTIDKAPVFTAIRKGRFYSITNTSYPGSKIWGNSGRGYDKSEVFVREYDNASEIELLTNRGQVILEGAESRGKIQQALLNINPEKEFIIFAVFPDSFDEFNYVKELFINKGFDYNWSIVQDKLILVKSYGVVTAQ